MVFFTVTCQQVYVCEKVETKRHLLTPNESMRILMGCIMAMSSDLPKMGGTSTTLLTFVRCKPITATNYDDAELRSGTKNGTLKVEPVSV